MDEKKPPALKVLIDGKEREITYEELTLSNNLAQEALVRLLITKKIVDPKEYLQFMEQVKNERYKILQENQSSPDGDQPNK
jgi:hypothetical protein